MQETEDRRSWRRIILVVALAFVFAACGTTHETLLTRDSVVLIIGDSITAGYGIDGHQAWPTRLADAPVGA